MEKLIKKCKEFVEENPTYYGLELTVSDVKLIVEALEKQIPKEPTKDGRKYFCPDCRGSVGEVDFDETIYGMFFCSNCGKKIN